jgi:hypothetical protein
MLQTTGPLAAAAAAALWLTSVGEADLGQAPVVTPKAGWKYSGKTEQRRRVTLQTGSRSIEIVGFSFACGQHVAGYTSLSSIRLRSSDSGYRFKISAHGIVSYSDERPDQNASIALSGRFSRTAKTVQGLVRVKTPRCRDTGDLTWRATRS